MKARALVLAFVFCSTGCYRATIRTGLPAQPQPSTREVGVSFLYGLSPVNAKAAECRDGLAMTSSFLPWWGVLVMGITAGLITPWEMEYWCAARDAGYQAPAGTP